MVGGGTKIGGGPPPTKTEPTDVPKKEGQPTKRTEGQSLRPGSERASLAGPRQTPSADRFERTTRRLGDRPSDTLAAERSGSKDVLKMARQTPAVAKKLLATIAAQTQNNIAKVEQELAGARAALEQLAARRFAQKELDKRKKSLKQTRDRIASLKMRINLGEKKMALLQQVAGKLDDPQLATELGRILGHHTRLQTAWGRRHHLLSLSDNLFGADSQTPEHLREVVKTDVTPGPMADAIGDTISEVSPRRLIAELIARTLDGSAPTGDGTKPVAGARGEHGTALQAWATLSETMDAALSADPFVRPKGKT